MNFVASLVGNSGPVSAIRMVAPDKAYIAVLTEMGVGKEDFDENLTYFGDLDATPESGLDWIFERRVQRTKPQTRFTDGSIPVYYTALDRVTAESETAHWLVPVARASNYFRPLIVDFWGKYVDLVELKEQPAFLTGEQVDGAYDRCLSVTREAIAQGHDALKTPSARLSNGICFPIFSRKAIRSLKATGYVRFDYDEMLDQWTCRTV